jgi:plasmid replication initiation protein
MNHKNLTVYKANKVIEAGYKLTLNEQRVVLACIAQVHSKEALLTTDEFELSAKDFATIFAVSDDNAYHALVDVAKTLFARYVVVDNPYPDRPRVKRLEMRWISSIEYLPDDGKISLCFSKKMLPFLSELKRTFTKYRLEHIGKMTCVYAIRLYELLVQWQSTGTREIQIDWLKKQFQIDDKYAAMKDFKKYVIDPAVKDINKHSNFQVRWEQRKTGRRVTHLTFTFTEKQPLTPEKPKRITKPKEKMILGVPVSEIVKVAAIGESYEDTAGRINRKKAAKKTPAPITTPTPTDHIEKMGIKKPQATAPVVSPSFAAESEAHRISVINYFVSKHKAAYLAEFNSKGFVSINGISGAIIEADLKLAGLFD